MVLTLDQNNEIHLIWTNETEEGLQAIKNFNPLTDLQHDFSISNSEGEELASLSLGYEILEICGYGLLKNIFITGGHNYKVYLHEFSKLILNKWSRWDTLGIGSKAHISELHSNSNEWFYANALTSNITFDEVKVLVKHGTPIKSNEQYVREESDTLPFGEMIDTNIERFIYYYENEIYELITNEFNEYEINKALIKADWQHKPKQLLISGKSVFIKIGVLYH